MASVFSDPQHRKSTIGSLAHVLQKGDAAIGVSVAGGIVRMGPEIEVADIRIEKALGEAGGGGKH